MVSLKEEVLHIQEYIELEKIRFQDTLKVEFTASEIDETIQVAPMLLIPFVENAFKHGSLIDGFMQLEITIGVEGHNLNFRIRNSYVNQNEEDKKGGIGLVNINKRLELNYPKNYKLETLVNQNWYAVNLEIADLKALKYDK